MNSHRKGLLVPFLLASLLGCGPSRYVVTPNGDTASIETEGGVSMSGELLCIQDSSVYIVTATPPARVMQIAVAELKHIQIEGYANRNWVVPVVVFQEVPAVLLAIAAGNYGADAPSPAAIFLVASVPAVLTFLLFETSTPPPPEISGPGLVSEIHRFSLYARFPQGLTDVQFQAVLKNCGQAAAQRLH